MSDEKKEKAEHSDYITVYRSIGGWKAVHLTWNPAYSGFYEPENVGVGGYANPADAESEARQWAEDEGLEFVPCKEASN